MTFTWSPTAVIVSIMKPILVAVLAVLLLVLAACDRDAVPDPEPDTTEEAPSGATTGEPGPAGPPGRDARVRTYVVEQDETTPAGAAEVEASASAAGHVIALVAGGDRGAVEGPHDLPLRPLDDRPSGDGAWICRAQNSGVGVDLKVVSATAVCLQR